jgi:hypothetical protein
MTANRNRAEIYMTATARANAQRVVIEAAGIEAFVWDETDRYGTPRFQLVAWHGRAIKPLRISGYYKSSAVRERNLFNAAANYADRIATKAAYRSEQAAKRAASTLAVGDVLRTCWGYDQTNVEYFEIIERKGQTVTVREIAQERNETGFMQGTCVPMVGKYIGPAMRKRIGYNGESVKIHSSATATKVEPHIVAGVKIYGSASWTAYA